MKAQMDSQQVRLDSLEDLLDVMAVGNPTMQRMLSERRAALGLPSRNPEESDPNRQHQSNPTDYFDNMCSLQRKCLRVLYIEIITWALPRSLTCRLRRILSLRFTRNIFRRKRNESFMTKPPLRWSFNNETSFEVNSS
ncbi:hypothetical protein Bca4012_092061 [Brassica carinata]